MPKNRPKNQSIMLSTEQGHQRQHRGEDVALPAGADELQRFTQADLFIAGQLHGRHARMAPPKYAPGEQSSRK